jgi:phospholipid/cholesterol/gamma-HCH transport system substrate-binding protein
MIQRKYETIVGLFVVASLAALLVMVVVIAQQERLWEEKVEYHTIFKNIGGLKEGSEVRLAGVTVGSVKKITIDPQGRIIVVFDILGKYKSRIREDSRATIGYMGLLGDKSLDISAGSQSQPAIPPEGLVASVEPLDVTEMLARAGPGLDNLQKILANLASVTEAMSNPESDFSKSLEDLKETIAKINHGQGSLGMFINDPTLYREATRSAAEVRKITDSLAANQGLLGAMINDPAMKSDAQKTLAAMHQAFADLQQSAARLKEAAERLPEMARKGEAFFDNLSRAGQGLPGLVASGQEMAEDVDRVAKAAQKSWLLRSKVPQPREHSILLEGEPGKE